MKVTVSSTSMMKPILYTHRSATSGACASGQPHPQRIIGLLESSSPQSTASSVTSYQRPDVTQPQTPASQWQHFLYIPNGKSHLCAAVFGFEFDGENTWYQLWNTKTNTLSWLKHGDGMDYQPYAILAMDALVTLLPEWNGELYLYLSPTPDNDDVPQQLSNTYSNGSSDDYDLQISDAAATSNGQLWFLVTVKAQQTNTGHQLSTERVRTGWISNHNLVLNAA